MRAWFTADLHFGHRAILDYTNRPFTDLDDMKMHIVATWNRHIRPSDVVYILGDFSFEKKADAAATFSELNGRKHLIIGNHDGDPTRKLPWESVSYMKTFRGEGVRIVMCHYPLLTWDNAYHGALHIHGHSHGNINNLNAYTTRMDVGIDNHPDLRPFSLEELLALFASRGYAAIDHHRAATQEENKPTVNP